MESSGGTSSIDRMWSFRRRGWGVADSETSWTSWNPKISVPLCCAVAGNPSRLARKYSALGTSIQATSKQYTGNSVDDKKHPSRGMFDN